MTDFAVRPQIEEKGLKTVKYLNETLKEVEKLLKTHGSYHAVWMIEGMFTAQSRSLTDTLNTIVRQDMLETIVQKGNK